MTNQTGRLRVLVITLFLALATGFATSPALAQSESIAARLITSTDNLTVGDPMELTIEVTHPTGYQVFIPKVAGVWGDFEARNESIQSTVDNGDGTSTTRKTVDVALFAPGQYLTPALPVTISDPNGQLAEVTAAPVQVSVTSILIDGDTDLRDIKPQASLTIPATWPLVAAAAVLLLILVGVVGWKVYRAWRTRPKIDTRTPEQIAHDDLGHIGTLPLVREGNYKDYYAAITDCLRDYIRRQYGIATADRTTGELKRLLHGTRMSGDYANAFGQLFAESDLVKFAGFSPSEDAAEQMLSQANLLVTRTAAESAAQDAASQDGGSNANPPTPSTAAAGA